MMLALTVYVTVLGTALLWFRQERLHIMHAVAVLHTQINHTRQGLWDLQVRIADLTGPRALGDAIARSSLDMQPVTGVPGPSQPILSAAGHRYEQY